MVMAETEMSLVQLHGSALAFLLEGDDEEAADALARCVIERGLQENSYRNEPYWYLTIYVRAPRSIYDQVRVDYERINARTFSGMTDLSIEERKQILAGRIWDAIAAVI